MMSQRMYLLMSCLIPLCVSCSPDHNTEDSSNLTLQPPAAILAARMVDPNQLSVVVTVDGESVDMSPVGDGNFSGSIDLSPDRPHNVEVRWNENFNPDANPQGLLLARAAKSVSVTAGDTNATISIRSSEFNTSSWDQDSDGRSNLAERREGSDPNDPLSPEAPPMLVAVEVQVNIPNSFQAGSVNTDGLTMVALVNSQSVALTRSGLIWTGGLNLIENSDAFIDVTLFREVEQNLRIGVVRKSVNIGAGGLTVIADTDFDFQFDDDNDGLTNLEEILNGFDPLNSESPVVDPCVPSTFVAGCNNDTDGDGISDFIETEDADEDGDMIPDFQESNIIDIDQDLLTQYEDIDDTEPCIPNDQALACLNQ